MQRAARSRDVLKTDVTWLSGGEYLEISKTAAQDLSSFKGIEAKVKIDSGVTGVQAKLFIQLRGYKAWIDSGAVSADSAGFTTLRIDFSSMNTIVQSGEAPFTPDDLKSVDKIGIQLVTPSGTSGTATVYVDEVKAYN